MPPLPYKGWPTDAEIEQVLRETMTEFALRERCRCAAPCPIHGESGWLLEGEMRPEGQTYIGVVDQLLGWITDPNKAIRLSRREDADALAELVDDCWKVSEHCWPPKGGG
jgi:hypothetical protein